MKKPRGVSSEPTGREGSQALVLENLTKRFGDRTAFSDVSLSVDYGEVFGFLGPNGAGKTTAVRTLATLLAPSSGSAIVANLALNRENSTEIRRRIAVMPESPGLYLRLTVAENLRCFAGLYELRNARERIDRTLRAVNLVERANDPCAALSKGLRQRVGLARVLLSDPRVLFLDEPTSGLDPAAAREVHELIDGLRRSGVTIFLTTHRLDEAERLCDRVAILNTTLRTIGRPQELREQLFQKSLVVRTLAPLTDPGGVFRGLSGVESWREESRREEGRHEEGSGYIVAVADPTVAAPEIARSLVAAGADILSITEAHHSLEDVYLELISEDVEASARRA